MTHITTPSPIRTVVVCTFVLLLGHVAVAQEQPAPAKPLAAARPAATPASWTTPASQAPQPPATPQPGAADAGPDTGDDAPGVLVSVSLEDGIIKRRLPFDVPFYVTGTATIGSSPVTAIELRVYQIKQKSQLTTVVTELAKTKACVPPTTSGARAVSRSTWSGTTGTTFMLLVEPLAPQRYYAFCFVAIGPVPAQEIEEPVRRGLADAAALMLTTPDDLSLEFAVAFQARLANTIEDLGRQRAKPAEIPEGNVFHRQTVVARGSKWHRLLAPLVDPYQEMPGEQDQYDKGLARLLAATKQHADLVKDFASVLPTDDDRLPTRDQAIRSTRTFDVAKYSFEDAVAAVEKARKAAASAETQAALDQILGLITTLRDLAQAYGRDYERVRAASQLIVAAAQLEAREIRVGLNSSVLSADLNRSAYVSLDAGMAYPWQLENMVFYAGTNIYVRPINKKAPLGLGLWRRLAFTIGVTTTVQDASRRAEDLRTTTGTNTTTNSLLLGAGFRITPSLRVSGGALIFKETDPNPLITQKSAAATPFVGFSIDVDLGALFKGFFPGP